MSSDIRVSETDAEPSEEATMILSRCLHPVQPRSDVDTLLEFEYLDAQELQQNLLISNFLALSLLRKPGADAAAVAVYNSPKSITVYFTKNDMNLDDRKHVFGLFQLAEGAREKHTDEFIMDYFDLMLTNARDEMLERFRNLKILSHKRGETPNDYKGTRPSVLMELARKCKSITSFENTTTTGDQYILELSHSRNLKKAFISVVKQLNEKLESTYLEEATAQDLLTISAMAWAISDCSIISAIPDKALLVQVLTMCRKVGVYYHGARSLFIALFNSKRDQAIKVHEVTMVHRTARPLQPNLYEILKLIYFRAKVTVLPISKAQWVERFPDIESHQTSWKSASHQEIMLIKYLEEQRKWPIAVGTSKPSCAQCHVWISQLNSKMGGPQWSLSGIAPRRSFRRFVGQ